MNGYTAHKLKVEKLSRLAEQCRSESIGLRHAMGDWKRQRFSRLEVCAWLFAAGAFWAAGRRRKSTREADSDEPSTNRTAFGLANLALLGWRYFGKTVTLPPPDDNGAVTEPIAGEEIAVV